MESASRIRFPDGPELSTNRKNDNEVTIFRHGVIVEFFDVVSFSCQVCLLVQVSCRYHHWLWSYDNFLLYRIDQKSGNSKYPRLSFNQYLETGG